MSTSTIEERVALLEQEVQTLKRQLPKPLAAPWWEQISGVFADVPAFSEAADLGRQYRESQRPEVDEDADVSAALDLATLTTRSAQCWPSSPAVG